MKAKIINILEIKKAIVETRLKYYDNHNELLMEEETEIYVLEIQVPNRIGTTKIEYYSPYQEEFKVGYYIDIEGLDI